MTRRPRIALALGALLSLAPLATGDASGQQGGRFWPPGSDESNADLWWADVARLLDSDPERACERIIEVLRGARSPDVSSARGLQVLLRQGRTDLVVELGERLLALPGRDAWVRAALQYVTAAAHARQGAIDPAIALLEDALRFRADLPQAERFHTNLAELLLARGRTSEARFHLERAIAISPGWATARVLLSLVHAAEGRRAEGLLALTEHFHASHWETELRETQPFWVPAAVGHLVEARAALHFGDRAKAEAALGRVDRTNLPATWENARAALAAELANPGWTRDRRELPGCLPSRLHVAPDDDRFAALCDSTNYAGARFTSLPHSLRALPAPHTQVTESTGWVAHADATWIAGSGALRVMFTNGLVVDHDPEAPDWAPRLVAHVQVAGPMIHGLTRDGTRVISATHTGIAIQGIEDGRVSTIQPVRSFWPARITSAGPDEALAAWEDNGFSWIDTRRGRVSVPVMPIVWSPHQPSAVSRDGTRLALQWNESVVILSLRTWEVVDVIAASPSGTESTGAPTALAWGPDGTLWAAGWGWIDRIAPAR